MKVAKKLAVRSGISWYFAKISSSALIFEKDNKKFYKVDATFGITEATQTDPSKLLYTGKPGDLLIVDYKNELSIMSKSDFNLFYKNKIEKNITKEKGLIPFSKLNNKDFYTEVVRNRPR